MTSDAAVAALRVLLVTHFYPAHGGGIERVAAQYAARLAARGVGVTWCASDSDALPCIPGVRPVPMQAWNGIERSTGFPYPLWSVRSLARLSRAVHESDAVHVHDAIYAGSLAAAWFARRHGRRLVVSQHIAEVPLPAPLRPLLVAANRVGLAQVLRRADVVAFVAPPVRRHFATMAQGGVPASSKWVDLPNGVDDAVFCPGTPTHLERARARRAAGCAYGAPLLLFVGRFAPKKRLPIVRDIAAARPDWQFVVVGQGLENPRDWGLPNVQVPGALPPSALVSLYRAADLLLLPSHGEGFPLVVQEAMACGLPACITAEVAAGASLPADAWVELPAAVARDARAGVDTIQAWWERPDAERRAQRAGCADFARRAWNWDTSAGRLEALLRCAGAA